MIAVLDTNVVLAAVYSQRGASSKLLSLLAEERFDIALTLPLFLEYQDVLSRDSTRERGVSEEAARELCEDLASIARGHRVYFLWRPWLRDPKDDLVLEAAVVSRANCIVTHNVRDFRDFGIEKSFGIEIMTPKELLARLNEEAK